MLPGLMLYNHMYTLLRSSRLHLKRLCSSIESQPLSSFRLIRVGRMLRIIFSPFSDTLLLSVEILLFSVT